MVKNDEVTVEQIRAMNPIGGDGEVAAGGKSGLVYALKSLGYP